MELGKHLEEKQVNCQTLQSSAETLDGDVQQMLELRQKVRFLGLTCFLKSHVHFSGMAGSRKAHEFCQQNLFCGLSIVSLCLLNLMSVES